jgi:hypothetical protein
MDDDAQVQDEQRGLRAPLRRLAIALLKIVGLIYLVFVVASLGAALLIKRRRHSIGDETSDEIDLVTIFEGRELESRATAFRGGRWIAMFGGGELDLREATLAPEGATLTTWAIMGGGDIQVPDGWKVEVTSKACMGGTGVQRPHATEDPNAPTLRVKVRAIMGGVAITSGE